MVSNNGNGRTCGACVHCKELINLTTNQVNKDSGVCRRNPPQVIVLTMMTGRVMNSVKPSVAQIPQSMQPIVLFNYPACGEFKAREKE